MLLDNRSRTSTANKPKLQTFPARIKHKKKSIAHANISTCIGLNC